MYHKKYVPLKNAVNFLCFHTFLTLVPVRADRSCPVSFLEGLTSRVVHMCPSVHTQKQGSMQTNNFPKKFFSVAWNQVLFYFLCDSKSKAWGSIQISCTIASEFFCTPSMDAQPCPWTGPWVSSAPDLIHCCQHRTMHHLRSTSIMKIIFCQDMVHA